MGVTNPVVYWAWFCVYKQNMASKMLSPQCSPSELEDEEELRSVPENIRNQTQVLFYEYVDSRCSHDRDLSKEQASLLHESASTCIRKADVGVQVIQMGKRLLFVHVIIGLELGVWLLYLGRVPPTNCCLYHKLHLELRMMLYSANRK